jgi:hypothetical protein
MDDLIHYVVGQKIRSASGGSSAKRGGVTSDEENKGKRACVQTAAGSVSKAMKGLVGGVAEGSANEREPWARSLIPRSENTQLAASADDERREASAVAWGKGDFRAAKAAMRDAAKQMNGFAAMPQVKVAPLSAAGPSGDRQEHLDAILSFAGGGQRRRLMRAIDSLTVRWAIGDLPAGCRWLLNTLVIFLRKEKDPMCKHFADEEWLPRGDGMYDSVLADVPEDAVTTEDVEMDTPMDLGGEVPPKVRPIQMGEFLRKYVSRRLLALTATDIERLMLGSRQFGVGAE